MSGNIYGGQLVSDSRQVADYAALRASSGQEKQIYVTGYLVTAGPAGVAGCFVYAPDDTTSADNGGTILVRGDGRRYKRAFDGPINVLWFGADRLGVADSTAAIQAAVDSITLAGTIYSPQGDYKLTGTITVLGAQRNVTFIGDNGVESIIPGGARIKSASIWRWGGANNGLMCLVNSTNGTQFEKMAFAVANPIPGVHTITGVIGIRYINRSSTRFSSIVGCSFLDMQTGVQNFDDGLDAQSDLNMDGHLIQQTQFFRCVVGVHIKQSNVYDTEVFRCSFYGSTDYTKHHIWIEKGHANVRSCYLGAMKDAASVGGKDGIAIYVQLGWVQLDTIYSEGHNAPLLVWDAALPVGMTIGIINCTILNSTASIPTTYNILNKTGDDIIIVGGRIAGKVCQLAGTAGSIAGFQTRAFEVDSTSEPNKVAFFGTGLNSVLGQIGTYAPVGGTGGGKATMLGYSPAMTWNDLTSGTESNITYNGTSLNFNKPGYVSGPNMNFTTKDIDLASSNFSITLGAKVSGSVTLATGAATTVVAATGAKAGSKLLLTPTTAAAANLVNSAAAPYKSAISAGVSFTIATADGSNAGAGCTFDWVLL